MSNDYDRPGFPSYLLPTVAKIRERWDSLDSDSEADSIDGTDEKAEKHTGKVLSSDSVQVSPLAKPLPKRKSTSQIEE